MNMKPILWDKSKAQTLALNTDRNITFERCLVAIEAGDILANIANPSRDGQNIFVLNIEDYAYVVPYVEDSEGLYLKTVFPSRKYTKLFLK